MKRPRHGSVARAGSDALLGNCFFYISPMYEFSRSQGSGPVSRRCGLNVRLARKRTRLGDLWARRYRVEAQGLDLPLGSIARLAQNEKPGCAGSEAEGGGGLRQAMEINEFQKRLTDEACLLRGKIIASYSLVEYVLADISVRLDLKFPYRIKEALHAGLFGSPS
jgi:hypothetical protein